jgi:hypothetical protein
MAEAEASEDTEAAAGEAAADAVAGWAAAVGREAVEAAAAQVKVAAKAPDWEEAVG